MNIPEGIATLPVWMGSAGVSQIRKAPEDLLQAAFDFLSGEWNFSTIESACSYVCSNVLLRQLFPLEQQAHRCQM